MKKLIHSNRVSQFGKRSVGVITAKWTLAKQKKKHLQKQYIAAICAAASRIRKITRKITRLMFKMIMLPLLVIVFLIGWLLSYGPR